MKKHSSTHVEYNSVWQCHKLDGLAVGLYRVLTHYPEQGFLVLFPLMESKKLERPVHVDSIQFNEAIEDGFVERSQYPLPFFQLEAEENISAEHRIKRDRRFTLIEGLVSHPHFLQDIALNPRSKLVSQHAKLNGTYVQSLYRSLNLYWKYGQERNALLPAYKNSGGAGKPRLSGTAKRGSPVQLSSPSMKAPKGVNTLERDKELFVRAMKRFGLQGRQAKFSRVYDQMLKEFYADELIAAETEGREAKIPTYRAFIYWVKKLIPQQELIRKQTTQGDFDRNRRGLRGSATDHTQVPGSCFELDATVLDVHVVSEFRRNHVLGRPTVYCVVDKESRMIVGLHVSMEYASWRAGRQALVNSFTSKKEYCASFGIEIGEGDWPCSHIPQRLLCDRGEFVCSDAENLAVPLIGHLSIAPPYRAELKGIVEHRFQILNEKLIHELMGTTRGRQYIRGDIDPRLDAALTLKEINKLLIDAVLDHNSHVFSGLAKQSTLLIESELAPTPLNYWKIHTKKHRHALSKADEADIRARLLPVEYVSMTSKGLRLNDLMYYRSDHPEFENWKVIARTGGSWQLESRIDQDNSSYIYVRMKKNEGFTRCTLMKESANFSRRHHADILLYEDWNKLEKQRAKPSASSVERHQRRKDIIKNAREDAKGASPLASKAERTRDMKERRKQAILDARLSGEKLQESTGIISQPNELDEWDKERKKKVVSLLKRKKDRN